MPFLFVAYWGLQTIHSLYIAQYARLPPYLVSTGASCLVSQYWYNYCYIHLDAFKSAKFLTDKKGISMKCPKCGYRRQARDNAFVTATECPACGIVYAKHDSHQPAPVSIRAMMPLPHFKPSPVDAVSLKKARERVEKRLRQQLEIKVKDQRHAETLKLARQFAAQGVRKRQEHWEKNNSLIPVEQDFFQQKSNNIPSGKTAVMETIHADTTLTSTTQTPTDPAIDAGAGSPPTAPTDQTGHLETPTTAIQNEIEAQSDVHTETIILASADIVMRARSEAPANDPEHSAVDSQANAQVSAPEGEPLDLTALVSSGPAGNGFGSKLMRLFPTIAWLILCSGVIGAVLSWTTISDVQAGGNIPVPDGLSSLPLGVLLGFAYLATGALGFAFFRVSSLISRQLKDVRRLLLIRPAAMITQNEPAPHPSPSPSDA